MLDIEYSTHHLIILLDTFLTIFLLTFVLKQQNNSKATYTVDMKINIYLYVLRQTNNNIVSPFRDLCLETVKRFIDYEVECNFGLRNAEDLLQDGRFFKIIFIILSRF